MSDSLCGWQYRVGHVIDVLRSLPEKSVQCVVTSPPYFALRVYDGAQNHVWGGDADCEHDWETHKKPPSGGKNHPDRPSAVGANRAMSKMDVRGVGTFYDVCPKCGAWKGSYGLEPAPEMYVEHTVEILREIRRVLKDDGVVFWNIGDSYAGSGMGDLSSEKQASNKGSGTVKGRGGYVPPGLKAKDLMMIPFRVALAAQADGWYVRDDIIWAKPNAMPSSVRDRTTTAHEHIFLFTKKKKYFYDQDAIREPCASDGGSSFGKVMRKKEAKEANAQARRIERSDRERYIEQGRNMRSVWGVPDELLNQFLEWYEEQDEHVKSLWTMRLQPYPEAHFAVFPEELPKRCILAGTSAKGNCPKCGKPWVRRVEKTEDDEAWKKKCGADSKGDYRGQSKKWLKQDALGKATYTGFNARWKAKQQNASDVKRNILKGMKKKTFTWVPSCKCNEDAVPAVVLDPFAGSGTTLKVARDLGRHAIGIDISEEYRKLAMKRTTLGAGDITGEWE